MTNGSPLAARSAQQTTLPPCVAQSQAEDLMNGCHAVPTPVPTQRQPEPEIKLAGLGRFASSDGCSASATASTPLNLMHHRLLPPEQLGLIPALATTG